MDDPSRRILRAMMALERPLSMAQLVKLCPPHGKLAIYSAVMRLHQFHLVEQRWLPSDEEKKHRVWTLTPAGLAIWRQVK